MSQFTKEQFRADSHRIARDYGIHFPMAQDYLRPELRHDYGMAADAQPALVTVSNAGVPAFLTNFIDPEVIRVMVTPNKAAEIFGETKKGDWTMMTTQFPVVESTGEVSSYGDYSNNGSVNSNTNWVSRESYLFQTVTQWGELELERAGLGKINYASEMNIASALTMDKFMNKSYFFGVSGLKCYGLLNDPALITPITPLTSGTGSGTLWSTKDGAAIYADVAALFRKLVAQTKGLVERTAPMTLALSPEMEAYFTNTNQYNVNVITQLKSNFPNLVVKAAVEYATTGGQLMQLIVNDIDGQKTGYCAFSEKMRAHPVKVELSSFMQKKSGGSWGAIIRQPLAISQMLGL